MSVRVATACCAVLAVLAAGCAAGKEANGDGAPRGEPAAAPETNRTAAIYAAVIRRLIRIDNTFGGGDPGFTRVYVIDGAVLGAADPMRNPATSRPTAPFSDEVKAMIVAHLSDLPPLEFVGNQNDVVRGADGSPGSVKSGGVLVTLGRVRDGNARVEVESSLWIDGLAGSWQTYVLKRQADRWAVTGTTGPIAIS